MHWKRRPPRRSWSLSVALAAFAAVGWVRPAVPTSAKPAAAFGQRLDYVIVAVNGEPHLVHDGEELAVVRGDMLVVRDAVLHDPKAAPRSVRLVGARHGPKGDDRGLPFTTEQLRAKDSEDKKGETFAVLALTRGTLHGAVFVRVVEPELRYAEILVNGRARVLRDGEPLTVKATDQVKVQKVVTNLQSTDGVLFRIDRSTDKSAPDDYRILFTRAGVPFATIPLKVDD